MTDQPKFATGGVIHGGHADVPPWQPHRVLDSALQTIPEAKAFALEQAVDCCRWLELHDAADPAAAIVKVAQTFEEYLTGKETP